MKQPPVRFAALVAVLVPAVLAGEPYPERNQVCVSACESTLKSQTFVPVTDDTSDYAQSCNNSLHFQSVYGCAQKYCDHAVVASGWRFLDSVCRYEGYPIGLPSLARLANTSLDGAKTINATSKNKNLNTTVIADADFWDNVYGSILARAEARFTNRSYEQAIYIFWGIVIGLAVVVNLASKTSLRPPPAVARITRPLQAHLSVPPLYARKEHAVLTRLEALVVAAFFALSLVLCAVSIKPYPNSWAYVSFKTKSMEAQMLSLIARRCGDMAVANLPLIWLFSMRNNPLIWASGLSFATFNQFHRWVARVTFLEMVVHAGVFTKYEFVKGGLARFKLMFTKPSLDWWNFGVIAIVFFSAALVFAAAPIRARFYDSFLLWHILLAVVFFSTAWYHLEPQWFLPYLYPVVAIWALERLMRIIRAFATGVTGRATLSVDPSAEVLRVDATSLLQKSRPTPGSTYYLYCPTRFPFYQSHPFTLVAYPSLASSQQTSDPDAKDTGSKEGPQSKTVSLEGLNYRFMIAPQKGFTKSLYDSVNKRVVEGSEDSRHHRLPVLLEGPYLEGIPSVTSGGCKDVLFVVGGSGISVAVSAIYRALARPEISSVTLVWAVRRHAMLRSAATEELRCALANSKFSLKGYVTQDAGYEDKALSAEDSHTVTHARPDVSSIVQSAAAGGDGALGVTVCGPQPMVLEAKKAVAAALKNKGSRDLVISVESFCW